MFVLEEVVVGGCDYVGIHLNRMFSHFQGQQQILSCGPYFKVFLNILISLDQFSSVASL